MTVENTNESAERKVQGTEDVSSLIKSLKTLEIQRPSKEKIEALEDSFSQITLHKVDDSSTNATPEAEDEETKDSNTKEDDSNDKVGKEEKDDDEDKNEDDKENTDSKQKQTSEDEAEKDEDEAKIDKKQEEDGKVDKDDEKVDKDSEVEKKDEEHSDDENESDEEESDDEKYTEQVVVTQKKTNNMRGPCIRGPGVQTMSPYSMYPGHSYGFDSHGLQANSYTSQPLQQQIGSQGYMPYDSPPYASSPGYQSGCLPDQLDSQLDMSPYQPYMSSATSTADSYLCSPISNGTGGYYQNDLASPEMGINQGYFNLPDSPNSCLWDDNESLQMPSPSMQMPSPCPGFISDDQQAHDVNDVLAAIDIVEKKPRTHVPVEELLEITQKLQSCETANPGMVSDLEGILEIASQSLEVNEITAHYRSLYASMTAEKVITNSLDKEKYINLFKRLASMTNEDILKKDEDGDTPVMIIVCTSSSSPDCNERLVAAVERTKSINVCCELPVNKAKKTCGVCLNSDANTFYSALAMKNLKGDTLLSAVMKLNYPELIITYICENLMLRSADILHVFDEKSVPFFQSRQEDYPIIKNLLHLSYQMRNSVHFEPWRNGQ